MSLEDVWLLIVIIILSIFNAIFSLCEAAYSGANKVRLMTLESNGNKRAAKMLKLLQKYDKVITTILIGNTVVTVVTASLSTILFVSLFKNNPSLGTTLSTIVTTVAIVVFCEITPKILGKENPEKTGMAFYPFLAALMVLFTPLTWLFSQWKKLLKKVFRIKNDSVITEDELLTYVETAASEGGIEKHESNLIRSAIEFEDVNVEDIMIPRVNVIAINEKDSLQDISEKFREHAFSRMPVYAETIDSIVGILHERDFHEYCAGGQKKIKEVLQSSLCVPPTMKISAVLRMLQKQKVHMAIVVDEFGGTAGVVTLEDILEELVGEIWDEHDEEEVLTRRISDDTFIVLGTESLTDLFDTLGFKTTREFDSTSVGGFVTELLEKIPVTGEKIIYDRLEITVTKANMKRVLETRIRLLPAEEEKS